MKINQKRRDIEGTNERKREEREEREEP